LTTWAEIEDQLYYWIDQSTGLVAVWAKEPTDSEESAPAPDPPYVVMQFISGPRKIGNDDEVVAPAPDGVSETFQVIGQRDFVVQISAIGPGGKDTIEAARMYFQRPSVNGSIQTSGTRTVRVSTVTPLADYVVTINGEPVIVTASAAPTAEEIRDLIVAAVNAAEFPNVSAAPDIGPPPDVAVFIITGTAGVQFFFGADTKMAIEETVGAVDLVYLSDNDIIEQTDLFDATWEEKQINEFTFGTSTKIEDTPGVIREVEITNKITNETFIVKGD
jgi:hypothetical protein